MCVCISYRATLLITTLLSLITSSISKTLDMVYFCFRKTFFGSFPLGFNIKNTLNAICLVMNRLDFFIPHDTEREHMVEWAVESASCCGSLILTVFKRDKIYRIQASKGSLTNKTHSYLTPLLLYIWLSGKIVSFSDIKDGENNSLSRRLTLQNVALRYLHYLNAQNILAARRRMGTSDGNHYSNNL